MAKADYYAARCSYCHRFMTDKSRPNHASDDLDKAWIVKRGYWKYLQQNIDAGYVCCEGEPWQRVCISLQEDEDY